MQTPSYLIFLEQNWDSMRRIVWAIVRGDEDFKEHVFGLVVIDRFEMYCDAYDPFKSDDMDGYLRDRVRRETVKWLSSQRFTHDLEAAEGCAAEDQYKAEAFEDILALLDYHPVGDRMQLALRLKYVHGCSLSEIAEAMAQSKTWTSHFLTRASNVLRDLIVSEDARQTAIHANARRS